MDAVDRELGRAPRNSPSLISPMMCALINHPPPLPPARHMSEITAIFLAPSTRGADPPHQALACTGGAPAASPGPRFDGTRERGGSQS